MSKKLVPVAIAATMALSLLGAAGASAATEFGNPCVANRGTTSMPTILFEIGSTPPSPLPVAAPSAGVITSWKTQLYSPPPPSKPIPPIIPQTLKVLRPSTSGKTVQVLGESSAMVGSGLNTFATRIAVQPGDRLGLYGSGNVTYEENTTEPGTLYCGESGAVSATIAVVGGNPAVGGSAPYKETGGVDVQIPALALIEPDADGDGFGDETQDQCPNSAASAAACPHVKLSFSATAKSKSVTVLATATSTAKVSMTGKVPLGKGKKAKLKAGAKTVKPGAFTKFKLKFPAKLTKRLKELTPEQSLTLKVTGSAPNLVGKATKKTIKVKLKGQAKPVR